MKRMVAVALVAAGLVAGTGARGAEASHPFAPGAGFRRLPVKVSYDPRVMRIDLWRAMEGWNRTARRVGYPGPVFVQAPGRGADAYIKPSRDGVSWVWAADYRAPYGRSAVFMWSRDWRDLAHELGHLLGLADHSAVEDRRLVNAGRCVDYVGVMSHCDWRRPERWWRGGDTVMLAGYLNGL